ncbi:UNVERIFIED_CONTAM: hypothetical protein FKN15_064845 [Acipenser sinensis]
MAKTEAHLKKAYAAKAKVTHLANTADLLMAYLGGILRSVPLPEPVASELRLVSGTLLQISGFQGQALGRSLAGLVVARRQLCLSQARVPNADKSALLDVPISPGHTFEPAVEEVLQHSHREWAASRQGPASWCWGGGTEPERSYCKYMLYTGTNQQIRRFLDRSPSALLFLVAVSTRTVFGDLD